MAVAYRMNCSISSDDDSGDSDKECLNWKRSLRNDEENLEKIPIVPPTVELSPPLPQNQTSSKRKRNNVWSEVLEDQMISETLDICGIKNKPKGYGSRGAESYDYTLGKRNRYQDESDEEMWDSNSRSSSTNSHKRFRNDRYVQLDSAGQEAAKKIVRVLSEQKAYLIYRVVKYLGIEKAMNVLSKTEEIEENGGMMIKNNQRRRTPGGIYLHLIRTDETIEKETMEKIFEGEMNSFELKKKFQELRKKKKKNKSKRNRNKKKMDCETTTSATPSPTSVDLLTSSPEEQLGKDSTAMEVTEDCDEKDKNGFSNTVTNDEVSDLEEGEVI